MRFGLSMAIVAAAATVAHAEGLQWQKDWSKSESENSAAEKYCAALGKDWRLPSRSELRSLLLNPEASESAFRSDAPALPDTGYLWSGEDVNPSRKGQRWVVNLTNGHIFNGSGLKGFAKCVKGAPIVEPKVSPGDPIASIGAADAKLVIVVAMQPDYPWFKVRPVLDQLAAAHPIRFDLHFYLIDRERYLAPSVVLCAAAKAGTYADVEKQLAKPKADIAPLRKRVEPATAKACEAAIDHDHKAFSSDLEGVPTFWIGKQTIFGAQPIDKFEAAIKAAGG